MASAGADLICGVCTRLLSDPYSLPCGHTFCLRPCLLPHPKALAARCINCHTTFDVSQLRPNYTVATQMYRCKQEMKGEGEGVGATPPYKKEVDGNMLLSERCGACRKSVEAEALEICLHCHHSICPQCREKHRNNSMKEAMTEKNWLEKCLTKVRLLEEMVSSITPLPIMQKHLSDIFTVVGQHLSDFDLVVSDGLIPLPQLFPLCADEARRGKMINQSMFAQSTTAITKTTATSQVRLYIGGLRLSHTESQLRQHFAQYGAVTDCYIVRDCKTDESKGYAFVTFQEAAEASRALADCPHFIEGGPVCVKPSKGKKKEEREEEEEEEKEEETAAAASTSVAKALGFTSTKKGVVGKKKHKNEGSSNDSRAEVNKLRLFVGNLSPSITQQELRQHFSHYGKVTSVDVILDRESGKARGIAFVNMSTHVEVEAVLDARPHRLNGESIIVRPAHARALREAAPSNVEKADLRFVGFAPMPRTRRSMIRRGRTMYTPSCFLDSRERRQER
ncbi:unnamed protein product [Hydatigera taeniaeformis]|uniref:RRM domain-containing protein n=1 Tax=Hydatigena taeniaeformis TaxID=6205 RepID=A0A0R3XAK3_HYDTA|nr:unnamed protein product [Hydatigera taeniaeformis]